MNSAPESGFHLSEQLLRVFIPVVVGLIAYLIYWFTQESGRLKERLASKYGEENGSVKLILGTKILGAIVLGLLPFLVYKNAFPETTLTELGVWLNKETALLSLVMIVAIATVMILMLSRLSKSPGMLRKHPEIRVAEWPNSLVIMNLLAWAVYLFGYEFFFRGVLLFPLVDTIGLWPAIAVNVFFYAGIHIPKGADEAIAAIPLAIVLCLLTVKTGTIWIAFFVHLAMAWTVTLVSLKNHPNMRIVKLKR
jgi:membrane protease YdiL (CAAX protease family)